MHEILASSPVGPVSGHLWQTPLSAVVLQQCFWSD